MNTTTTTILAIVVLLVIVTKGRALALPLQLALTVIRLVCEVLVVRPYRVVAWMASLLYDFAKWVLTGFLPTALRMMRTGS